MGDIATIRKAVEEAVADVFTSGIPGLRDRIIERVLQEFEPEPALPATDRVEQLKTALSAIHQATTQSSILNAFLDGAAGFTGRAALFLVRSNSAFGWQARGFLENEKIKQLTVDMQAGLAAEVVAQRSCIEGTAEAFESRLAAGFGLPLQGNCVLAPLIVRQRMIALIYADGGQAKSGGVDRSALEILVQAAASWIELLVLRKLFPPDGAAAAEPIAPESKNTPALEPLSETGRPATPSPGVPAEMEELHRKARRFAKLLVDEIKLYHRDKVVQGKQNRDLYVRLREDIDKSRASYEKRYGQTPIAASDYFTVELIQNLADNNPHLLGSGFSR